MATDQRSKDGLSLFQERLWLTDKMASGRSTQCYQRCYQLRGQLDHEIFKMAISKFVGRHAILRSCFVMEDGGLRRMPCEPPLVRDFDLSAMDEPKRSELVRKLATQLVEQELDISRFAPVRFALVRLEPEVTLFFVVSHHIAFDAPSEAILTDEISELYNAELIGALSLLDPNPVQYSEYVAWQAANRDGDTVRKGIEFWRAEFGRPFPALHVPAEHRPKAIGGEQAEAECWIRGTLDQAKFSELRSAARGYRSSPFALLLAAFAIALCRYYSVLEIGIGTACSDRIRKEFARSIGPMINTVLVRLSLGADETVGEFVERAGKASQQAIAYQGVPFEFAARERLKNGEVSHMETFQALILHQSEVAPNLRLVDVEVELHLVDPRPSDAHVTLYTVQREGGLDWMVHYDPQRFSRAGGEHLAAKWLEALDWIATSPHDRVKLGDDGSVLDLPRSPSNSASVN